MAKALLFLLMVLLLSPNLDAQDPFNEAFGVPKSNNVITGEAILPFGKSIEFGAREGTMVKVRSELAGYYLAFVFTLDESGKARLHVFRIEASKDSERIYQIVEATRILSRGSSGVVETEFGSFRIRFTGVVSGEFPESELIDPRTVTPIELWNRYGGSNGPCCLSCGGVLACGTKVGSECGTCAAKGL